MRTFDVAVIGGGINGCGIARDAAGRGYSVSLTEQNDLGTMDAVPFARKWIAESE